LECKIGLSLRVWKWELKVRCSKLEFERTIEKTFSIWKHIASKDWTEKLEGKVGKYDWKGCCVFHIGLRFHIEIFYTLLQRFDCLDDHWLYFLSGWYGAPVLNHWMSIVIKELSPFRARRFDEASRFLKKFNVIGKFKII